MNDSRPSPLVHIETFGCQMNEYDTELVRAILRKEGFCFTEDPERADVMLMNTCAIRENAHSKVYGHLADLKTIKKERPLIVGLLGCMAQNLKSELSEKEPMIDVLVGPDAYRQLPGLLLKAMTAQEEGMAARGMAVDLSEYETYEDVLPERTDGVNAWIAVMRGCDNFCSFCVVPYTRGRERSRDPKGILAEAREAAAEGYKQITLLGQNVNSYRFDEWDFAKLIVAVADVPGIERVRFTSPHPKDFPPQLLEAVAQHSHICKHIHLPLQSGNDRLLGLMNRTYTRHEYLSLVDRIRELNERIALSTDIICGFCSETEEEFLNTLSALQEVRFHSAYIFKYSERKHTIAARKYEDDVPDAVKGERVARLVKVQRDVSLAHNRNLIGAQVESLVEHDAKRSPMQWMGRTDSNVPVIWEKSAKPSAPGRIERLRVWDASSTTLYGTPDQS
jgi:tRNA-2-methylthio-N6-dimethylallyladenosine synthase